MADLRKLLGGDSQSTQLSPADPAARGGLAALYAPGKALTRTIPFFPAKRPDVPSLNDTNLVRLGGSVGGKGGSANTARKLPAGSYPLSNGHRKDKAGAPAGDSGADEISADVVLTWKGARAVVRTIDFVTATCLDSRTTRDNK